MRVTVHFFAALAEITQKRSIETELKEGANVSDLLALLAEQYPQTRELLLRSFTAVNQEYVPAQTPLHAGDEVAIIPPVSGGSGEDERIVITDKPLSADRMIQMVDNPHTGAVVVFAGTVREFTAGKQTLYLEYEAYEDMAHKEMENIAKEIAQRWPQTQTAMAHRVGRLAINEVAVIIAVAAPHREEAFAAGRYAIERLKQTVPIWKKEQWKDGSAWVGTAEEAWNPLAAPKPCKERRGE